MDYVRGVEKRNGKRLTGAQGWIYYNWAKEDKMTMFGQVYERTSPGYIKQEYLTLLRQWENQMKSRSS